MAHFVFKAKFSSSMPTLTIVKMSFLEARKARARFIARGYACSPVEETARRASYR